MENKSSTEGARRLGPNTYLLSKAGGAIVHFSDAMPSEATMDTGKLTTVSPPNGAESIKIMAWGTKNDVPNYREELITGNNIVPALIERKRNIIAGQGWYAYKEKFIDDGTGKMVRDYDEVPMPAEAEMFFKKFTKVARQILGELLKHGMAMPEFVRFARAGQKIASVKSLEVKYIRAGKKNKTGEIDTWYWGNIWPSKNTTNLSAEDKVVNALPVYDEAQGKKQGRFVLPLMDDLFNDGYYPIPAYWGGRHWINLSNIIPLFHEANLKNGSFPRWNLVIPHDYFYDYESMGNASAAEERAALLKGFQAKEQAFVNDFNKVMTDIGNAGRTITTKSEIVEALGGKYEKRIQIEPINIDMGDEKLLKLFAASNVANISSQALHPTLASIETAGKLSSGTEIRNAFLMYLIIAAPVYRDMLMEVVDLVKQENKWPADIKYAIRDAEMTALSENPAGVQNADTQIGPQ